MTTTDQVKQLVSEINRLHQDFSTDYFESGRIEKVDLSRTIANVPTNHIYKYRLFLHESINDYLMKSDIVIRCFYRVKTRESIEDKIQRFSNQDNQYPVNNWLYDIFGARIILSTEQIATIIDCLDDWKTTLNLKNWYLRDKHGYKGLHIYFKNKGNFYFPWELQIWDEGDIESNIANHQKFKRQYC